jgi:hypothetical protein
MIILKNKHAQNEIAGFVMIVVIVVIIGLFLLVFSLRHERIRTESQNVQNFLKSSLLYTTSCSIGANPEQLDLGDVMKKCYEGAKCSNSKDSCQVLNETYSEILDQTWKINSNRPVNYYSLHIYYKEESKENNKTVKKEEEKVEIEEILNLTSGNCNGSIVGGENFLNYNRGNIVADLEICYI